MEDGVARTRTSLWGLMLVAPLMCIGCGEGPTPNSEPHAGAQRIVCLSPALSRMIADLGASDRIVGVHLYDPLAAQGVRVVGLTYNQADYEALLATQPTDIVLQINHPGERGLDVPQKLRDLAAARGWRLWQYRVESMQDVLHVLRGDAEAEEDHSIGALLGKVDEARALAARIERRMTRLREVTEHAERKRVLMLVGIEPQIIAAGRGTYIDAMLAAAGGVNALDETPTLWPTLDHEQMLSLQADVAVYVPPPGSDERLALPPGVRTRVAHLLHDAALIPSTSVDEVAAALAKVLHPELADEIDFVMNGLDDE